MLPDFPHFTKLTPEDKATYNQATADYPPYSDILFSTLHIWWNLYEKLAVCSLNGNLVIRYHLPFDDANSGYCLVGKKQVDSSIKTLFDYLRAQHEELKLVHVPEFVVEEIKHKDRLHIQPEEDYKEYILDAQALAKLEGHSYAHIRTQINRFLREVEGQHVEHKVLDLALVETQDNLMQAILKWEKTRPPKNDPERSEHQALSQTLAKAAALDIEGLALYINGQLHGFILYHQTPSKDHFVIHHLRFDYTVPYVSDYMTNHLAKGALKRNVPYINMEMDLGKENLRRHKMKLNPVNFLNKFTITPA